MGSFEDALGYSMEVSALIVKCTNFVANIVRHMSSLGALFIVVALAIDPFVQQVASIQSDRVASSSQNATLPVRWKYTDVEHSDIKGAVYNGLFGSVDNTLSPYCPSGNCTFPPYQTLAICSQCVDVKDLVKYTQSNIPVQSCDPRDARCFLKLPNGLTLSDKIEETDAIIINMSGTLSPMKLDKVGYATVSYSLMLYKYDNVWATECSLYWCVNTYTASISNTIFKETFNNSWYNATSTLPFADLSNIRSPEDPKDVYFYNNYYEDVRLTFYNTTPPRLTPTTWWGYDERVIYAVANESFLGPWLCSRLSGNATRSSIADESAPDAVELFYEHSDNVPTILNRLAQSLTTAIRTSYTINSSESQETPEAIGTIWKVEAVIKVR